MISCANLKRAEIDLEGRHLRDGRPRPTGPRCKGDPGLDRHARRNTLRPGHRAKGAVLVELVDFMYATQRRRRMTSPEREVAIGYREASPVAAVSAEACGISKSAAAKCIRAPCDAGLHEEATR